VVRPTVLVVDDHAWFRAAATALLEAEGFTVVGEAGNGNDALSEAERLRPQVVLLDIQLPGTDGFEVARRLASTDSPPADLLLSSRSSAEYGDRVARSPARGCLEKRSLSGAAVTRLLA
jgi:DNA-binding NarL/FixJ family response regulator